jgi:hypothetical protein
MGSVAGASADASAKAEYTPLAPEQWQESIMNLKMLYVLKYPRIL